jgi:hypothetical protein
MYRYLISSFLIKKISSLYSEYFSFSWSSIGKLLKWNSLYLMVLNFFLGFYLNQIFDEPSEPLRDLPSEFHHYQIIFFQTKILVSLISPAVKSY